MNVKMVKSKEAILVPVSKKITKLQEQILVRIR